jgi:glycerol-3-phosphate acyltransferase PlsY
MPPATVPTPAGGTPGRARAAGRAAAVVAASWLAGSVPTANLFARRIAGVDLRGVESGTVSGTGLYRVAGFGPLAVAGVLDIAKGSVGPLLAGRDRPRLQAAAGAAAVVGHNWSPFLRGAGGRGISPAIGAMLATEPVGAAVLLGGLAAGRLARQTGLGALVADAALVPVLAARRGRQGALLALGVVVPMLAKRLAGNRPPPRAGRMRVLASRLLFDNDTGFGPPGSR